MSDFERADQILAIARILARFPTGNKNRPYMGTPAPIRPLWAGELYDDFGVRVHPDLAKKDLVLVESILGSNGPVIAVDKGSAPPPRPQPDTVRLQSAHKVVMEWLWANMPELAEQVEAAQHDPTLAAIVLNKIRKEQPELWERGQQLLAETPAEGFA